MNSSCFLVWPLKLHERYTHYKLWICFWIKTDEKRKSSNASIWIQDNLSLFSIDNIVLKLIRFKKDFHLNQNSLFFIQNCKAFLAISIRGTAGYHLPSLPMTLENTVEPTPAAGMWQGAVPCKGGQWVWGGQKMSQCQQCGFVISLCAPVSQFLTSFYEKEDKREHKGNITLLLL